VLVAFGANDLSVIGEVPDEVLQRALSLHTAASGAATSRTAIIHEVAWQYEISFVASGAPAALGSHSVPPGTYADRFATDAKRW
jgi:hypothetical protein